MLNRDLDRCAPRPAGFLAPWVSALCVMCTAFGAAALPPETSDARAIADAVEARPTGDRQVARMTMTLTDASGRQRVRVLQTRALDIPGGKKNLMLFESPADVRNTGLLSIDYDDGNREDDQWLYLPSLHKSTRISSSEESGSFLGSDITYADMTRRDNSLYDFSMVEQSANVDGEDCWVIEARAKTPAEANRTGYLKSHVWVSKSKLLPIQIKSWVTAGRKLKYIKFTDVRQVNSIWVAHTMTVRTTRGSEVESTTVMKFDQLRFDDPSVQESDFTERRLEQGL